MALLVAGADPSVTDKEGNTVAEKTSQEIKSALEAAAAARTGSQEGKDAALLRFAGEGQTAAMQVLLRAGADPAKASAGPAGAVASVAVVRRLEAEEGLTFEPARVTGGGGGGGAGDHAQQQEEKARGGGGERGHRSRQGRRLVRNTCQHGRHRDNGASDGQPKRHQCDVRSKGHRSK